MRNFVTNAIAVVGLLALADAAQAADDPYATIRQECAAQLQLSSSGCGCIESKARAELNDTQLDLLIAHITKDGAAIMEKQQNVSGNEMMEVINFLAGAPSACAGQ